MATRFKASKVSEARAVGSRMATKAGVLLDSVVSFISFQNGVGSLKEGLRLPRILAVRVSFPLDKITPFLSCSLMA